MVSGLEADAAAEAAVSAQRGQRRDRGESEGLGRCAKSFLVRRGRLGRGKF